MTAPGTGYVEGSRAHLDGGTVGEGIGVRHAELDDVAADLVEDADRLLGGVDATVAGADERDERALPAPLELLEGLGDGQRLGLHRHGAGHDGLTADGGGSRASRGGHLGAGEGGGVEGVRGRHLRESLWSRRSGGARRVRAPAGWNWRICGGIRRLEWETRRERDTLTLGKRRRVALWRCSRARRAKP